MSLRITELDGQARGVAEGADGPLRLALTLPGEEVAQGADGRTRIVVPSPRRVRAACAHFGSCGGCALQHADDAFVAEWKLARVRGALAGQGLDADLRLAHTAPPATRRRATFAGRRTKKGVLVGFHARGSDVIVPVPGCIVITPALGAAMPALEELTALGASRSSVLGLSVTASLMGPDIAVTGARPLDAALRADLAGTAERHDIARLAWNGETLLTRRPPEQAMGRARVVPPPGAFLQATECGAAALAGLVTGWLAGARRVADLFSGCGTFALPLAETAEVLAVEADAAMLAALDAGWRKAEGLRRVTVQARDLFRSPLRVEEFAGLDAVVLDPPRAGAEAQCRELARTALRRIVMVSCNPVTFARDLRILVQEGGFRPGVVQVVDQFRWSPHVELAAMLERP